MKIGIFTQCYHPTNNGVVVSIDTFKKSLESMGHKVFIIAPHNRHLKTDEDQTIIRIPSLGVHKDYPPSLTFLAGKQKKIIQNLGLDIIHSQHPFAMGNFALKMGYKLKIPVVYTYHTLIANYVHYFPGPDKFKENIAKKISRDFCNKADQVVTPSKSMKELLLEYGVTKSIEVIPTGTNIADFESPYSRDELRKDWQIPPDRKVLLYVARVAREKNLDFLFESVKLLLSKRNDFQLLIVGGGPQLNYFKDLAKKLNINDHTTFTGMQKKPGVNRFFGAGDIFVFPSFTETQGIVVTEAMAAGVPPVAINKMGPSDIIKNGLDGYLTDLNINQFTDKIEYLLSHDDIRVKMGNQAKLDSKAFSTESCGKLMESLYEKVSNNYNSKQKS
jgi:glycosyltransferase involved in cell wall biosynthesis